MRITLDIPDEIVEQVAARGTDPARVALEALALEGYRSEKLSETAVKRMLGFDSRMQVHAFLKDHGAYLQYGLDDLQNDIKISKQFVAAHRSEITTQKQK
ncbi:MAG TPA: UPF0175 family protein [Candidatus Acidoferrales bacterium]|nr:UPF0175 family protein [Candidatus Acidoferrales bacterium]